MISVQQTETDYGGTVTILKHVSHQDIGLIQ